MISLICANFFGLGNRRPEPHPTVPTEAPFPPLLSTRAAHLTRNKLKGIKIGLHIGSCGWKSTAFTDPWWPGSLYTIWREFTSQTYVKRSLDPHATYLSFADQAHFRRFYDTFYNAKKVWKMCNWKEQICSLALLRTFSNNKSNQYLYWFLTYGWEAVLKHFELVKLISALFVAENDRTVYLFKIVLVTGEHVHTSLRSSIGPNVPLPGWKRIYLNIFSI